MHKEAIILQLESIHDLPTLPVVVDTLEKATRNLSTDAAQIADIIKDDPAMTARILKVVNSAVYSAAEPITSIQQAVARIGFNAVQQIAMLCHCANYICNMEYCTP